MTWANRISWTLRRSCRRRLEKFEDRRNMRQVCASCHSEQIVQRFFTSMDQGSTSITKNSASRRKAAMEKLLTEEDHSDPPYDEKIEWIFYELWHHEGRRARHGLSKMAPDYVHWQGFYEVAKSFYTEVSALVRELSPQVAEEMLRKEGHRWIEKGMTKEENRSDGGTFITRNCRANGEAWMTDARALSWRGRLRYPPAQVGRVRMAKRVENWVAAQRYP